MSAPTPEDFFRSIIERWEGGYENYQEDAGNWVTFPDGHREDIGTNLGVTPAALALHRGLAPFQITVDDIKNLKIGEAIDIGMKHYFIEPHFDQLPWGPATAALVDFGWGSGPGQATLSMQRIVGAQPDGILGPLTVKAYTDWEYRLGWKTATEAIHDMRASFYQHIVDVNPADGMFLKGWLNRDNWASAANEAWWAQWSVG